MIRTEGSRKEGRRQGQIAELVLDALLLADDPSLIDEMADDAVGHIKPEDAAYLRTCIAD